MNAMLERDVVSDVTDHRSYQEVLQEAWLRLQAEILVHQYLQRKECYGKKKHPELGS